MALRSVGLMFDTVAYIVVEPAREYAPSTAVH